MAVSIRGGSPLVVATTSNPVSGTLTGTQQPQAGDLLVIFHGNDFHAFASMTTPTVGGSTSGVTAVTGGSADAGTNSAHVIAYTYVVGSTGDLTVSATEGAPADEEKMLVVYVLSGADTTTPIDAAAGAFSSTGQASQAAASVSPTSSDAYLIVHNNSGGGGTANPYTPPSSPFTELYDGQTGGISYVGGVEQLPASGATGTRTFTGLGSTSWAAVTVAIKTAAAGSAPVVGKRPRLIHPGAGPSNLGRFRKRRMATDAPATGQSVVAVSQAVETDIATAIGRSKAKAVGQAAATDTSQPVRPVKVRIVGQATETDTATQVARRKSRAVGQAASTETATALAPRKTRLVGQASETDTARPITLPGALSVAVGQAVETASAFAVGRLKRRTLGQSATIETALGLARRKARQLGQPAEADMALVVTAGRGVVQRPSAAAVARPSAVAVARPSTTPVPRP